MQQNIKNSKISVKYLSSQASDTLSQCYCAAGT